MVFDRILDLMNARGIKKTAFASAIGVSYGNVGDWQSGRSSPSVEKLERIADYFDVTIDYLVGRDDRYPAPSEDACELIRIYDTLDREGRTVVLGVAYAEKRRCTSDEPDGE